MKYSKRSKDKVIELYATGKYSIQAICEAVGITRDTFYKWKAKPEFAAELERVNPIRLNELKEMAVSGLALLLSGKEYEEITTEYISQGKGEPKIKSQKRVKKVIMPNPTSVIFTLKNLDSKTFSDRSEIGIDATGSFLDLLKQSSAMNPDEAE
jgi:hypothetical protein